nr:F-box/FBD/LRR-repeat protein At1g13570-like [Ipomoea batatas]
MAQRRRIKTIPDASRDLISHLPVEVKDRILECLPTRDAARTALLSTHWNDAWLRHGRLAFDLNFFRRFIESKGYSLVPFVKIITCILLQRVQPVKKFSLVIAALKSLDRKLEQFDLDQWFLFLSRNGIEELCITHGRGEYKELLYANCGQTFALAPFGAEEEDHCTPVAVDERRETHRCLKPPEREMRRSSTMVAGLLKLPSTEENERKRADLSTAGSLASPPPSLLDATLSPPYLSVVGVAWRREAAVVYYSAYPTSLSAFSGSAVAM